MLAAVFPLKSFQQDSQWNMSCVIFAVRPQFEVATHAVPAVEKTPPATEPVGICEHKRSSQHCALRDKIVSSKLPWVIHHAKMLVCTVRQLQDMVTSQ